MLSKSGNTIIEILNPKTALVLIFTIQFFVSFQLGKLYTKFNQKQNPKLINAIINTTLVLVLLFLLIGLPANIEKFGLLENSMMWAVLGGIAALLIGTLTGLNSEKKSSEDAIGIIGIVFFIGVIIYLIYLMLVFGADKHQWLLGILVLIGGSIVTGFVFFYAGKLLIKLTKSNIPKPVTFTVNAIFISLAALSIIIWQSVHIYGQVRFSADSFGTIDKNYIIFSLFLTGILPFRILWAFAPPRKLFSIISGLLVIAVDIYSALNI